MKILQGKTWVQPLTWLDSEGQPVSFTGTTVRAQMRRKVAQSESGKPALLDLTIGHGITVDANTITLRAEAAATELLPGGTYLFEIEVTRGADVEQLLRTTITVEPAVVR